jgi:hypothetical protein
MEKLLICFLKSLIPSPKQATPEPSNLKRTNPQKDNESKTAIKSNNLHELYRAIARETIG